MSDEATPSERELVEAYGMLAFGRKRNGDPDWSSIPATEAEARRAMDRIKAQVWDAGFDAGYGIAWAKITDGYEGVCPNPYRGGQ